MHQYIQTTVDRDVFRAYDIRGIIDEQLDENSFYSIGRAISCRLEGLNRSDILIARDGRLTSEKLSKALVQGLLDSGINVVDLGMVPTPVMYFATNVFGVDSGLMVTGSHNPAEYNGIKMVLAGTTLALNDIDMLYDLTFTKSCINGNGQYQQYDILSRYADRISSDIKLKKPMKVVIDCGNGIAAINAPQIFKALGCEVIELFCDIDGRFPNHHPDPTVPENLNHLKEAVKNHQADIGLAFDGDGDRLGVITNNCEIIWPDRLMMMYVPEIINNNPNATIVFDVKCSSHLATMINSLGGKAIMSPTGHSLVKKIMKDGSAALAGEMSGHIFFKDRWYGFDDATYSACRLLEILSRSDKSVSQQFSEVPDSINTPEIKIPIVENRKFSFMQQFIEESEFPTGQLISIDGLRVEYEYGWGLIRASNTTPCLVARFEAKDVASMIQIQASFKAELCKIDKNLVIPF
jgi:phosphomannomutase